MKESSPVPPDIDRTRSNPESQSHGILGRLINKQPRNHSPAIGKHASEVVAQPGDSTTTTNTYTNEEDVNINNAVANNSPSLSPPTVGDEKTEIKSGTTSGSTSNSSAQLHAATFSQDERKGSILKGDIGTQDEPKPEIENTNAEDNNSVNNGNRKKRTVKEEFIRSFWMIITYSWINVLLVFVPVGIVVANVGNIHPGVIFAMNCIAVIPLAGLLSHATESVASKMGDALGALLNVTFGNAVELIIFIIALSKDQIRIVQASLLGSILANLLLILGMGFFLGGLRYREQVYNSTVTQMSACLLSLSVTSLVLPTAFHASFSDPDVADRQSLKISRGTSVILLLVYVIYLLFQLKSHAYLYESTPQHIVDAEALPGPGAGWLDSSSSDDSSSSSSDSDSSAHSRDTMRRKMKKVLRGGRKRKSSIISTECVEKSTRSPSTSTTNASPQTELYSENASSRPNLFPRIPSTDTAEETTEDEKPSKHSKRRHLHRHSRKKNKKKQNRQAETALVKTISEGLEPNALNYSTGEPRRVDFAVQNDLARAAQSAQAVNTSDGEANSKRPSFPALRGMSVRNLAPTVFVQKPQLGEIPQAPSGPVPRVRFGIRRTNSLPDRLQAQHQVRPPGALFPAGAAQASSAAIAHPIDDDVEDEHLTRNASIILLLLSTGLVAACAEFLVGSIEDVVKTSPLGEIFIGLIILPIVGNAAEHVTAVTVAMKNKMDLAIGVALGSSIQIAIFVTPFIVILGWIMGHDMTLYFTLFETVCLFVSAFIVNFLVLDGRSNYLEGALLCAVYIIIAVVAFFYPDAKDASAWGD